MPLEKRTCTKCGEEKLLGLFPRNATSTGGYRTQCRDCVGRVNNQNAARKRQAQRLKNQFHLPHIP